ncbi:MAG: tRNA preQ1(34) S-adenosylmethionine ribosyltransferase-isomerase QueA [Chloroflexota bacterium]|nr:tRNA preQ1(34) S-adenosylmethionine ribosyltransferase-isomerase QueA [Chloroflexota bacterium]
MPMSDFDYDLPPELIAQAPLEQRSASRLMVLNRAGNDIKHRQFADLPELLSKGDLLVLNDSRVLPARLTGHRRSGGEVKVLLLRELEGWRWDALMRPARKLRLNEELVFQSRNPDNFEEAVATVIAKGEEGQGIVELDERLAVNLASFGRVPLPPYIRTHLDDDDRYQTVYAHDSGSAAAPTAGLHFDLKMFASLAEAGVEVAYVTLHVGLDTFRPVSAEYAEDHVIHSEWCSVPKAAAVAIAEAKARGSRVVAVGTTAARTLETYGSRRGVEPGEPFAGMTNKYITPGYEWTLVDAMITNFHLPKSTLLLMMSSFAGTSLLFEAYRQAIAHRYRFFSFGDAMFVE